MTMNVVATSGGIFDEEHRAFIARNTFKVFRYERRDLRRLGGHDSGYLRHGDAGDQRPKKENGVAYSSLLFI